MSDQGAVQTPLVDALRGVPEDPRVLVHEPGWRGSSTSYPVGRYSHQAADRIEYLQARVEELEQSLFSRDFDCQAKDAYINELETELDDLGDDAVQYKRAAEAKIKELQIENDSLQEKLFNLNADIAVQSETITRLVDRVDEYKK